MAKERWTVECKTAQAVAEAMPDEERIRVSFPDNVLLYSITQLDELVTWLNAVCRRYSAQNYVAPIEPTPEAAAAACAVIDYVMQANEAAGEDPYKVSLLAVKQYARFHGGYGIDDKQFFRPRPQDGCGGVDENGKRFSFTAEEMAIENLANHSK